MIFAYKVILEQEYPIMADQIVSLIQKAMRDFDCLKSEIAIIPNTGKFTLAYSPWYFDPTSYILFKLVNDDLPRSYLAADFVIPQISLRQAGLALSRLEKHNVISVTRTYSEGTLIWTINQINNSPEWR